MLTLVCIFLAGPGLIESLPAPAVHEHSLELLANSRYSVHSGFTDSLPVQVLANVVWAMARAPRLAEREIYVARADNLWRYDPAGHVLRLQRVGDHRYNSGSAFEAGVAGRRHEDAGIAMQAGLLAAAAFRTERGGEVVGGPLKWAVEHANAEWGTTLPVLAVCAFGRASARPLVRTSAVRAVAGGLPPPRIDRGQSFETLLAGLEPDSAFTPGELAEETVGQLLWAACGVTAQPPAGGRPTLTVPGVAAGYPQGLRIYSVGPAEVGRYRNQPDSGVGPVHRLETFLAGDRRPELAAAVDRLPGAAPHFFVVTVGDTVDGRALQEAGFAGFQLLAQSQALGLAGWLVAPLSRAERGRVTTALELPVGEYPALVFACGARAEAEPTEASAEQWVRIVSARPAIRQGGLQIEYWVAVGGAVQVEVFDMLGRPVRSLFDGTVGPGHHSLTWDGTGPGGQRLKRGTYLIVITTRGVAARHKVTLG